MQYDAQREYLEREGDAYFERNFDARKVEKVSTYVEMFSDFICRQIRDGGGYKSVGKKLLEVGCCYGYNLKYLTDKFGFVSYGIEPSEKAIVCGKNLFGNRINFMRGTADNMQYEDEFFDVVVVGFCLYQVDRKLLSRALVEIDRVLANGGFLLINDFDTPVPCKRKNTHNRLTPTYKNNYGDMFASLLNRYTLVEKRTYSFEGDYIFLEDIQERVSTQIFYKEKTDFYFEY